MDEAFRTIIVEDEPLARRTLRAMIAKAPNLQLVGEAANAPEARRLIMESAPELIFLDVLLPGGTGIDVVESARPTGVVVFTTAFDDYARTAFELGALDYLTKPFGQERLARALGRAMPQLVANRVRETAPSTSSTHAISLVDRLRRAQQYRPPLECIYVRDRGAVIPVAAGDIVRLEAGGDFVTVVTQNRRHMVYMNLGELADQFDALRFLRIHRSHVINMGAIRKVMPATSGRVQVHLLDGARIVASRAGTRALRARMRSA